MDDNTLQDVGDILAKQAQATFVYVADHLTEEGVFDVMYYSEKVLDDYDLRLLEQKIEMLLGVPTELNNLKECDIVFISELLNGAKLIYCSDERDKNRFLANMAKKAELMRLEREIMLARLRESGVCYEN